MFSYNTNDDSFIRTLEMKCECGHTMGEHSSYPLWSLNTLVASICALCDCKQFKVANVNTNVEPKET